MNQKLQQLLDAIQKSAHLGDDEKNALEKNVKDADKELEITTFKLDRTEKVKRTTAILLEETIAELEQKRKAVEEKNRELEIETALEKVRTVAMSMNNPDDMLDVCRIISQQLYALNVKEIRNVQTAIIYESKGTYLNYEYYAKHDKLLTTEVHYNDHPMSIAFVQQMLKGTGEIFTRNLTGKELKEWYAHQQTTNQFLDTYLKTADSLSYYWFSLGPVALGISTYASLNEELKNLFIRFRNVFELSYRRFLDIEKALGQAKEARIETSLERVRAVAMAMKKSGEVINVCEVMYNELVDLGFDNIRNAQIAIKNDAAQSYLISVYSISEKLVLQNAPYKSSPIVEELYNELGKSKDAFFQKEFSGKQFDDWRKWRESLSPLRDEKEGNATSLCFYLYSIGDGHLGISTYNAITNEQVEILKRFKNVFELSYQRYTDVAKAEAQARESQIELALERVRARTMAMQKSDELAETSFVLFQQFKDLGETSEQISIGIFNEYKHVMELYSTLNGSQWKDAVKVDLDERVVMKKIHKAWKEQKRSLVIDLSGKRLREYNAYRKKLSNLEYREDRWVIHIAFFSKGALTFSTTDPHLQETIQLLERFAGVFDQTYTRFLDLQKAEAQTRESQIELGLERVRARAMAMQKSGELSELVDTVFRELTKLDFALTWCIINIIDESSLSNTVWAANPDINKMPESYHMLFEDYPFHHAMMKGWKERKAKYVYTLEGNEKKVYDEYLFNETEFRKVPEAAQAASRAMEKYVVSFSFSNFGGLQTVGEVPLSDANLDILSRFGKVFDLTYTRFNDLKQAEAQSKEAQIQLALERVRARTMAMQKSDELSEAVYVLFQQFKDLGENPDQATIGVINGDEKVIEYWVTMYGSQINKVFKFSFDEPNVTNKIYKAWKENKKSLVIDLSGDALTEFMTYRAGKGGAAIKPDEKRRIINVAFFSKGLINIQSNEGRSEESIKLLARFASVFEQTYTRFLDLQKAEAQARESQIQLALERVRARTMAMQKSEELQDVVHTLLERLKDLNVEFYTAIIILFSEDSRDIVWWLENKEKQRYSKILVPYADIAYLRDLFDARENGSNHFSKTYSFEEKNELFHHLFSDTDFRYVPEAQRRFLLESKAATMSVAIEKNTGIHLTRYTDKTFSEEDNAILKRFVNVFEQTYTRFLDLQKAETQAREAHMETALERVRSRSMAMQKSEELKEVIQIVYDQFVHLKINVEHTGFVIDYKARDDYNIWIADPLGVPSNVTVPYFDCVYYNRFNEAKKNEEDFFATNLSFEEKNEFYQKLFEYVPGLSEEAKEFYFGCPGLAASTVLLDNVGLYIENFSGIPYTDEDNKTLLRFGKVFEQAYIRFLDLQKAEAQAKEAKIEVALEKVRSRTMAMQRSDELSETAAVLFQEFKKLGEGDLLQVTIAIYNEAEGLMEFRVTSWAGGGEQINEAFNLSIEEPTLLKPTFTAWKEQKKSIVIDLRGNDLEGWLRYRKKMTGVDVLSKDTDGRRVVAFAFFSKGHISFSSPNSKSPEVIQILERFAGVFDLTYTRFLDLQKAEMQAREATIEAALEKVRGKAMAMHNSNDLSATASVVFTELRKLGISPIRCGVGLLNKQSRKAQLYSATSSADGDSLALIGWVELSGHPVLKNIYDTWIEDEEYFPELSGKQLKSYYELLLKGLSVKVPDWQSGQKQYGTFLPFTIGCLYAWSEAPYNEVDIKILKRFANIIDLTFRRYIDLQKSETSAREVIKQAALDRIRADIASMRTTKDLERITPLIWNELNILGVPFIRCGVFIMNDEQRLIHTFLSTPDGKAIAAFHIPYDTPGNIKHVISHWRDNKNYIDHWDEDAFTEFARMLVTQGALTSSKQYLKTIPQGGFYLNFLPFLQGMLYVGNTTQLRDDEINLIQSIAAAFSTAYARYEDFNKLEAAKKQVDITLTELQVTQKQLIQSEKMASLGELTAGIAHEIQNPLNFVNNFSEVSNELIEELKSEKSKVKGERDEQLEDDLLNDIKQNLEKINHHGKRADAIVKGMLQHSRSSTNVKEPTDINKLADEYLRLAYHGLRAKDNSFNATMKTGYDESIGKINIVPQDIGRVILNLITNAFYAVSEKAKQQTAGYEPVVSVATKKINDAIELTVTDNGNGIPQNIVNKIFQPFFTTKPTGQGTGLGLSLAYDIIKAHGGSILVNATEGSGSDFIVQLPLA